MAQKFFTYGPDNVGELLTSTLSVWASTNAVDQVFSKMDLLKKFISRAKEKDGGASILQPVMYGANGTAQSYSMYDILDITPQSGFTNTQAKWKNVAVSVAIAGDEMDKNSGPEKVLDLLEIKKNQAITSLRDLIAQQLFAAAVGSKDIESLVTMIDATSTIQDVNSTNNSWWQSTVTTGGSFATQGLDDMRTTDDTISEYEPAGDIDTVVTNKTIKNYYEASLTPNMRYTPAGNGEPTFSTLKFRGADVFSDPKATSGVISMFSMEDLFLCINSNANFKTTEFVKPADQDAMVAQIIFRAQLVTAARRKLAKITDITA